MGVVAAGDGTGGGGGEHVFTCSTGKLYRNETSPFFEDFIVFALRILRFCYLTNSTYLKLE